MYIYIYICTCSHAPPWSTQCLPRHYGHLQSQLIANTVTSSISKSPAGTSETRDIQNKPLPTCTRSSFSSCLFFPLSLSRLFPPLSSCNRLLSLSLCFSISLSILLSLLFFLSSHLFLFSSRKVHGRDLVYIYIYISRACFERFSVRKQFTVSHISTPPKVYVKYVSSEIVSYVWACMYTHNP